MKDTLKMENSDAMLGVYGGLSQELDGSERYSTVRRNKIVADYGCGFYSGVRGTGEVRSLFFLLLLNDNSYISTDINS